MGASIKFNGGQPSVNGPVYPLVIEITGPSSYAAGGFSVAAAALGLTVVDQIGVLSCSGGLIAEYIKSTAKVMLRYPTGGAGTSPATVTTAPVAAVTSGTVTLSGSGGDPSAAVLASLAAGLTPGVGKELPDTANASTITVTLLVMGRV